jgi:hypothetical protein
VFNRLLASCLAYWTGGDRERVERLFGESALGQRAKWRKRADYRDKTIDKAMQGVRGDAGDPGASANHLGTANTAPPPRPALPSHTLGDLALRPELPHRSPNGKVSVAVSVTAPGGEPVDRITVSDSASGKREAVKALKALAPGTDPGPIIGRILAGAAAAVDQEQAAPRRGPTVADILAEKVPPRFRLVFRTERGAYSEKRGAEITAADFAKFCPRWLVDACGKAVNCPPNRLTLHRIMRAELESLWATLVEALPTEDQANVGPKSPAAKRFRGKVEEVLTDTITFEAHRTLMGTSGEAVSARSSLIERVRAEAEPYLKRRQRPAKRERWRQAQRSFDCWWRPATVKGKTTILIGLRFRIGFQTKKVLPGVVDQESFRRQCERAGISVRIKGGRLTDGSRLVVLAPRFVRKLLAQPRALWRPLPPAGGGTPPPPGGGKP